MSDSSPTSATADLGAAPTAASGASAPSPSATEPDWTDQVTDLIVDSVDKVRARTTGPILEVSQGAVHALVAAVLLVPVLALTLVGLVRLLNWAIPGDVWFIYAGLGMILVLAGVVLWRLRTPRQP
jgi:hypothetical protein